MAKSATDRALGASGTDVTCSRCGATYRIGSGDTAGCPKCGAQAVVPLLQDAETVGGHATLAGSPDDPRVTLSLPAAGASTRALAGAVAELTAEDALDSEGRAAGRYVQQGVIAQGGMGEIVLCVDRDTRRPVAMKRMLAATAQDPTRRARFVEEAQVTAQLEHPNIVPVYELTRQPDGTVYYTMKLVKGKSLADILAEAKEGKETPSLGELLQAFLKVCDGVAFAHSRGVIHRDLKPANIMVGSFGEVLVMDWGLAKVVGRADVRAADVVDTSRIQGAGTRTAAGSTIGTPAYMPPEQAEGKLDAVDERSDIYSLGAILYEVLTLERAVQGETMYAVLANALKGNIVPPERRAPNRGVPRELSAIAMKCLSKLRARRYRSALDLKRDISQFLEGRSVSAAPDTFSRAAVKLVKRNKGISAAVAAAAVVLAAVTVYFVASLKRERDEAMRQKSAAQASAQEAVRAQKLQRETAFAAAERFARQAVLSAEGLRWAEAEGRLADAEAVCPDCPWNPYARGRFAQLRTEHEKAVALFGKALALAPGNRDFLAARAKSQAFLRDIADAHRAAKGGVGGEDWQAMERLAETMMAAARWREAEKLFGGAARAVEGAATVPVKEREEAADRLQHRIGEARSQIACEGFLESIRGLPAEQQARSVEAKLSQVNGAKIRYFGYLEIRDGKWLKADLNGQPVKYLAPFRGLPLTSLNLHCNRRGVRDLSPLRGMPLTYLKCYDTNVGDLTPLKGMALTYLDLCKNHRVTDISPLEGMPLRELDLGGAAVSDLGPLKGAPLTSLNLDGTRVTDLSPIKGAPLTWLNTASTGITDFRPLAGMPLKSLACNLCRELRDLGTLRGLPLEFFNCGDSPVADLTPLAGMLLKTLSCYNTRVTDLSPLRGLPLEGLDFRHTAVSDLTPLKGMPLKVLNCGESKVSDLSPLRGMSLGELDCTQTGVSDLSPLKGMSLKVLNCAETPVSDLSPLEGMSLETLAFTPKNITKGLEIVRRMASLTRLGDTKDRQIPPEEFWRRYDAGEFGK